MSGIANPLLVTFSNGLPETSQTREMVERGDPLNEIEEHAKFEWQCFMNLDTPVKDGKTGRQCLDDLGYKDWWQDAEENDPVRMLGYLKMIYEMAEELGEDDEDEDDL